MSIDIFQQSVSIPGMCDVQVDMRRAEMRERSTDISGIGQEIIGVLFAGQIFKDPVAVGLNELGRSIREKAELCSRCDGGKKQGPTDLRDCPVLQGIKEAALKGDNYFTPNDQTKTA